MVGRTAKVTRPRLLALLDFIPSQLTFCISRHDRKPIRAPHKVAQYAELIITQNYLSSLAQDELYSVLEQVAIAAIETARFDLAESCIARLSSRFPTSQRITALQGMLLEGRGNPLAALQLYDIALETDSTSLILSRRRIACLKTLGGAGGAAKVVEALNKHVDTFYNDPEAWQELAEIYAEQGMYAQSAFALEEVILQVPQNAFFHLKYAETLYTQGEVTKAYKAYLRVLELCQSDGEATTTKGGPWVRALWGFKMVCTHSLFPSSTTILRADNLLLFPLMNVSWW